MTNSLLCVLNYPWHALAILLFSSFFYINKEKKRREPRSSVVTHLSFSVPSFFSLFLIQQNPRTATKEKKKMQKKNYDYDVKGMRKTEKERTYILQHTTFDFSSFSFFFTLLMCVYVFFKRFFCVSWLTADTMTAATAAFINIIIYTRI